MSGNTVTITAALADELRHLLLEARRMPAIAHDAAELAERLDLAVRLAAEVANSRPPAQLIPLPSQPERETATAVEALVAKTMLDMPPPLSMTIIVDGVAADPIDVWAVPRERERFDLHGRTLLVLGVHWRGPVVAELTCCRVTMSTAWEGPF